MACGLWFFALLDFFGLNSWITVLLKQHGYSIVNSVGFVTLITTGGIPGFRAGGLWAREDRPQADKRVFLIMSPSRPASTAPRRTRRSSLLPGWTSRNSHRRLDHAVLHVRNWRARSTGAGFASPAGRAGAIISPIVIGSIIKDLGVFSHGASSFMFAAVLVVIVGVETRAMIECW